MPAPTIDELKLLYRQQMAAIEQTFTRTSDGNASIRRRTSLVDRLLLDLVRRVVRFPAELEGIALVATGGYGRRELFPCSDVDLLLLCRDEGCEKQYREQIGDLDQAMWDLGLRASVQVRTLRECEAFDADNLEFTLALLDRRYLAGSSPLYQRLQNEVLPAVVMREWNPIAQKLAEIARARHEKFGNTIFHLEPNLKDSPGGLRDYHFAQWFMLLNPLRETAEWPRQGSGGFSTPSGDAEAAFEFLAAVRCFLHFRQGRDDNTLSWQAQDEAAAQSVGL
jgi:[protein-PII] uridylyltransferase